MRRPSRNNVVPRQRYDRAIEILKKNPDNLAYQHQAVLALARAGSLDFARREYDRYGLDKVQYHSDAAMLEDVLSLGGRLFKDLYLTASGALAQEYAVNSATKYEEAFKATNGYYSGINSATMSWLGGIPGSVVAMRARRVLELLSKITEQSSASRYYVDATRAEALLLLGRDAEARQALEEALQAAPLDYIAHASTLKQFGMISRKRETEIAWLSDFGPPRAMHFAGLMFTDSVDEAAAKELTIRIADHIQRNDIGFGYGALAAGADIIIAEALLEEGGELNVVLPTSKAQFLETSVLPFGETWCERFEMCWAAAAHHYELKGLADRHLQDAVQFCSTISMGRAIRRSHSLAVDPHQMIVSSSQYEGSMSAHDADLWANLGYKQLHLHFESMSLTSSTSNYTATGPITFIVTSAIGAKETQVEDLNTLLSDFLDRARNGGETFGLDAVCNGQESGIMVAESLRNYALTGGIYLSDEAADILAVFGAANYSSHYVGLTPDGYGAHALSHTS